MSSILDGVVGDVVGVIKENPIATVGIASGVTGLGVGATSVLLSTRKRSRMSRKRRKVSSSRFHKKRKVRLHKHRTFRKGKLRRHRHRGTKQIHYTSRGQPYVILRSGRARFISQRGARQSKKRKGGRY